MKESDQHGQHEAQQDVRESQSRESACVRRPLLDAVLLAVSLVLLVTVGVLLRGDNPWEAPTEDPGPGPGQEPEPADTARRLMLSLGMALFLVSLMVCMYAMSRMGFCCSGRVRLYSRRRLRSGIPSVNSSVQLIPNSDLPPSYDTVVFSRGDSQPPSYFAVIFQSEKASRGAGTSPAEVG